MKNKLTKLLIGLGMIFPVLTGCSNMLPKMDGDKKDDTVEPGKDDPTGKDDQPGEDDPLPVDDSGLPTYEGDTSREVGKINNVPVDSYKAETLAKIKHLATIIPGGRFDQDLYDDFVEYMLAMGVGDELAVEFCDFMDNTYHISMKGFNALDTSVLGAKGANFVDLCYQGLKIINSYDLTKIDGLFTKLNEFAVRSLREEYDSLDLASYCNVQINGLQPSNMKGLKIVNGKINNADLNNIVTKYEDALEHYNYDEEAVRNFNNYKAELEERINETFIIPQRLFNFAKAHANEAKEIIVKDLKLIVDAYGGLAFDIAEAQKNNNASFRTDFIDSEYGYHNSRYYYVDSGEIARSIVEPVLKNKDKIIGLLKGIIADVKLGNLLLDAINEVGLPEIEERFKDNKEIAPKIAQLKTKVNALSGKHISALASFVLKIINQISVEDLTNLFLGYRGVEELNPFDLGDKYIAKLDQVIAGMTAEEKQLILQLGQIFGVDIVSELKEFSTIYKNKNIETEAGQQKFQEDIQKWSSEIYEALYENILYLMNAETYEEEHHEGGGQAEPAQKDEDYYLDVYIEKTIYMNSTVNVNDVYINLNNEREKIDLWGTVEQINQRAAEMAQRLAELTPEDRQGMGDEELQRMEIDSQTTVENASIEIDTSKCGYTPFTFTFSVRGQEYSYKGHVSIAVSGLDYYRASYIYDKNSYGYSENILNGDGHTFAVKKDAEVYAEGYYDEGGNQIKLDTSATGWHFLTYKDSYSEQYSSYVLYFVTTDADLLAHEVSSRNNVGVVFSNGTGWETTPCIEHTLSIDGLRFYYSTRLDFSSNLISGKAVDKKYSTTVDGVTYDYVIVDAAKPASVRYSFTLNENLTSDIVTPTQKEVKLEVERRYATEIDGIIYTLYSYAPATNVTVNNFTYIDGVINFTYQGVNYKFVG